MTDGRTFWIRTLGSPTPEDPRDGELHELWDDELPSHFDLEPWDEREGDADARYFRSDEPPEVDAEGREVWTYIYKPQQPD